MSCQLWRIRRRERTITDPTTSAIPVNIPRPIKKTIHSSQLIYFTTRVIGNESNLCLTRIESTQSERSLKAVQNAELLSNDGTLLRIPSLFYHFELDDNAECKGSLSKTESQCIKGIIREDLMCVICLDDFAMGEQIRRLPCGHEYHCECIDPWLTVKSTCCPLCKYDCSMDIPKDESIQQDHPDSPPLPNPIQTPIFNIPMINRAARSLHNSSPSSFGPVIAADRAEEFSRSWMARSLPRSMRRQIDEAAAIAARHREDIVVLPPRMTENDPRMVIIDDQSSHMGGQTGCIRLIGNGLKRTANKIFKSEATSTL
ncbi:hypothetical protein BDB01DRAFT_804349 [Pilobolus umbonatus]|nr:hypothetical protein BDB01DRAFT_804349 [Pilobolus umbonatus]